MITYVFYTGDKVHGSIKAANMGAAKRAFTRLRKPRFRSEQSWKRFAARVDVLGIS